MKLKRISFGRSGWFLLMFFSVLLFFFLPPLDTDFGWHWRYGHYIWQNQSVLKTNTFTVLNKGYYWPQSFHGYQLTTYVVYSLLGQMGLSLANGVLMVGVFLLLYIVLDKKLFSAWLVFLLMVGTSWYILWQGWRAQVLSLFLTLALLVILKSKKIWMSIPLFLLWVNIHGGFVLGLAILGIYLLLDMAVSWAKKKQLIINKSIRRFIIGTGSVLVTLINPYGIEIWRETWRHMSVPLDKLIAEWTPPPLLWQYLMGIIIAMVLAVLIKIKKKSFWLIFYFFVCAVFFYLGFIGRRFVLYFFLFAGLFFASLVSVKKWDSNINYQSIGKAIVLASLFFGITYRLPNTISTTSSWDRYCKPPKGTQQPCKVVEYIKDNDLSGNFFNAYEWGGFLVWQLPESQFFVDGRMPAWETASGESPYTIYLHLIQARDGWEQVMDSYNIDYLLIGSGTFLDLAVKDNSSRNWQELIRDDLAVLYQKK
jgi:hypothetical protein